MNGLAVVLVLTAALLHAFWNLWAKRAAGGVGFVWLSSAWSIVVYTPFALVALILNRPQISLTGGVFIAGSAALHLAYFLLLNWSYQVGDLSLVYPIARGTGPMLATLAAILFLGERPSLLALVGTLLIGLGIFSLAGSARTLRQPGASKAAAYALLTGVAIASYTVWDKVAVSDLGLMPLLMLWLSHICRTTLLAPVAAARWEEVRHEWRTHARHVMIVAVLSPLAYLLVLTALVFSPVSHVAPMRECSTLIGTLMGTRLLLEGQTLRRMMASGAVVLGVIALGLG